MNPYEPPKSELTTPPRPDNFDRYFRAMWLVFLIGASFVALCFLMG